MNQKTFFLTTATIFLLIAILHIMRIIFQWSAVIGGWPVPIWLSVAAIVIALYLAYQGFKLQK